MTDAKMPHGDTGVIGTIPTEVKGPRHTMEDHDARRFFEHRYSDAQILELGDKVPFEDDLWTVEDVNKKGGGHLVTLRSDRGKKFTFNPRMDSFRKGDGSDLRNIMFYRPRQGF